MPEYKDIIVDVKDGIGTIKFNRPKQLNSFGGGMISETIAALRDLDKRPDTYFTVITGEGRFFAAGADVNGNFSDFTIRALDSILTYISPGIAAMNGDFPNEGARKVFWMQRFAEGVELVRAMIDHSKVLVLALNGPGVGAGAAWFQGSCDLFYAADDAWLQVWRTRIDSL